MKRIQVVFASIAILAAGAGVFANARTVFATTYYRAADADFGLTGAHCGVVVTHECTEGPGPQCSHIYKTTVDGITADRVYFISKKIDDAGICQIVTRAI